MRGRQSFDHLARQRNKAGRVHGTLFDLAQMLAFDELHHHITAHGGLTDLVDGDDIGVIEG